MNVETLFEIIGSDFYTGVPDSLLAPFCNYLMSKFGVDNKHHIIVANEGNCLALAAGYHLSTGRIPVIYMQNSGEGNVINPLASLVNDRVYAIPAVFIIGWRGEPGIHDEPQHIFQGSVTNKLMEDMDVSTFVIDKDTQDDDVRAAMDSFKTILSVGKQAAFVIRKGSLEFDGTINYRNDYNMNREEVIHHIVSVTGDDPIVSTTGKISRELFETRTSNGFGHDNDFLTVGSMGHCSSIALGVAINKPDRKIWCIDGDGAVLMHMGALAVIGSVSPRNLIHIVINNGAHETVGGMPTVAPSIDLMGVAKACGYKRCYSVSAYEELDKVLSEAKSNDALTFIEAKCQMGARSDLGRPTTTAIDNKIRFMDNLLKG